MPQPAEQRQVDEAHDETRERVRQETEEALRRLADTGVEARVASKIFDQVQEELQAQCFETFARSNPHDADGHRMQNLYLRVLSDVRDRINRYITSGEVARKKLINMPRPEGRIRRFMNRG